MVESSRRRVLFVTAMEQLPRTPNLEAQRVAMKKLDFLVGKWAGEARLLSRPGEPLIVGQTEEAQFKLGGPILEIEGIGRTKREKKRALQGLGMISWHDGTCKECMRAFKYRRIRQRDVKLFCDRRRWSVGFAAGC